MTKRHVIVNDKMSYLRNVLISAYLLRTIEIA
jgi:hypothetical protein